MDFSEKLKEMKMGKEIAKVEDKSKDVVAFTKDLGFTGFEGVENDAGAFAIPFLKIAQKSSDEVDEDTDAYIEGLEVGEWFNSVTGEIYDKDMNLIVVYSERVFNEYKPERKGFVGTHSRIEGEKLIRDKSEYPYINAVNGNELVETITMIVISADNPSSGVMVLPMAKMRLKHAKAFLNRTTMLKRPDGSQAPIYSMIYNFENRRVENEDGSWYQPLKNSIKKVAVIQDIHIPHIKKAYDLFKKEGVDYSKEKKEEETDETFAEVNPDTKKPF